MHYIDDFIILSLFKIVVHTNIIQILPPIPDISYPSPPQAMTCPPHSSSCLSTWTETTTWTGPAILDQ